MLGFSSAFIPRPRPPHEAGAEPRKPWQRKEATSRRFLVQRQGYLRNSRRILEIGSHAVLVLDLSLTVRTRLEIADVMAVKVGADENTFTLQMRKGGEAFVCTHRAELLSILLPIIQGDVGGLIFSLLKWSKRMIAGEAEPGNRGPVRFRLWSGKLAVIQEDTPLCASEIHMHTIARILRLSDDRSGLVLQLKNTRSAAAGPGRVLRFTVADADNNGSAHFSARDRLVRAIADSALAQLGLTLPIEETSEQHCEELFTSWNSMATDYVYSYCVHRLSSEIAKPRILDVASWGVIERDDRSVQLVHHSIPWAKLSHLVSVPDDCSASSAAMEMIAHQQGQEGHMAAISCGPQDEAAARPAREGTKAAGCPGQRGRLALCCSDGRVHVYESGARDAVIASLVEVAAMQGLWLPVCQQVMGAGWHVGGIGSDGDKEYEEALMERLSTPPVKGDDVSQWVEMAHECNCNLSKAAIARLWSRKPLVNLLHIVHERMQANEGADVLVPLLTAAARLVQARALFDELPQVKKEAGGSWRVLETLTKSRDELKSYAALGVLRAMVHFQGLSTTTGGEPVPVKGASRTAGIERIECANRQAIMDVDLVDVLVERSCRAGQSQQATLELGAAAALDLLDRVALSHAQSSDVDLVNRLLSKLGDRFEDLAVLFRHRSALVVKKSSLLVLGLIQGMDDIPRTDLQDSARAQCALLPQIRLASKPIVTAHVAFGRNAASSSPAAATNTSADAESAGMISQSVLSAQLVELLVEDNARSMDLLARILPASLLSALSVPWQESATATLQQRGSVPFAPLVHGPQRPASLCLSGCATRRTISKSRVKPAILSFCVPSCCVRSTIFPRLHSSLLVIRARNGRRRGSQPRRSTKNWPLLFQRMRADSHTAELIWNDDARRELCDGLLQEELAFELAQRLYGRKQVSWNDEEFALNYTCLSAEVRVGAYYLRFVLSPNFDVESLGQASTRFLGQLYHAFLTAEDVEIQVGCLNAMSKVYRRWDKQPFDALTLSSLVRTLGGTQCPSPVRDALLQFLEAAIQNGGNARQLVLASDCVPTLIRLLTRCHALRAAASTRAHDGVAVSIRSASLLRMLAEKQPGVCGADRKLVRPVPRAKRLLAEPETFSKIVQVLLYPNRELAAAVMDVIQVVLSNNDPDIIRTALGSGVLYLLLLGLKHILQDDSELEPHSVRWSCSDSVAPTTTQHDDGARSAEGSGAARGETSGREQQHRTDKMVELLGRVLGLLQPSFEGSGSLGEDSSSVSLECRQMLQDLLPYPLIIIWERQGPEALARTLASETSRPTVVWSKEMREVLWEHLHSHLDGFEMELALSPDAIWQFKRAAPLHYEEHERGEWLGCERFGYYLTLLARQVREIGSKAVEVVASADALEFQSMLLRRLESENFVKKQAVLVSILAGLLQRNQSAGASLQHGQSAAQQPEAVRRAEHDTPASVVPPPAATSREAAPGVGAPDCQVLAALLKQHEPVSSGNDARNGSGDSSRSSLLCESDAFDASNLQKWDEVTRDADRIEVLLHSIRVCQWIITPSSTAGRITPAAAADAAAAVGSAIALGVPDIVEGILRWSIEAIFYLPEAVPGAAQHPLRPLLPLALACVRFCEEVARSSQGLLRAEQEGSLVEILLVCLQCDDTSIIEAATSCVGRLCASPCLHAALVEGHLHLLLLRQLLRDVHSMMEGGGSSPSTQANPRIVRRRSLATVQALGQFVNSMDHSNQTMDAQLCALLTRPMMERLESPDDFLALFAGETFTPELVWGSVNRAELANLIKAAFHNLHVTSPKTPGGPSSGPLWGTDPRRALHSDTADSAGAWPSASATGADAPDFTASVARTPQRLVLPIDGFCFSNVRGLTRVGGIYIEVYNSDPRWQVEDPPSLLGKLFDAIAHGVDGRPASMRQRREALQAALHLAHAQHPSLPKSSVLISPTRIVLLVDIIRLPVAQKEPDRQYLFGDGKESADEDGGDEEEEQEREAALKSQVLALQLMALGSRMPRTSQVLVEQGLPEQLAQLLQGHVDRFLGSAEARGLPSASVSEGRRRDSVNYPEYESWTPGGIERVRESLDTDANVQRRLETQIAIIEVMGCVGAYSQSQQVRFSEGLVLPSLLLYILAFHSPLRLRAAAVLAVSALLSSPHSAPAHAMISSVLPPFLIAALRDIAFAAPPMGKVVEAARSRDCAALSGDEEGPGKEPQQGRGSQGRAAHVPEAVSAFLDAADRDVEDERNEWNGGIREEVVDVLTRAVRRGGYNEDVMPYLKRLADESVRGYILHRLNRMVSDGADLSLHVDTQDAPGLFIACVEGLAKDGAAPRCSNLQREMVYTIGEMARAGIIARGLWADKAQNLVQALFSYMVESLPETEAMASSKTSSTELDGDARERRGAGSVKGSCSWLQRLLQAAAPAVSCDTCAPGLAHSSVVRVLVEAAVVGERQADQVGEDLTAGALHVLGCAISICQGTKHELIHLILNDGHIVSQLKELAERGSQPALLLMSQLLEHPTEGEAVRLSIPERQFWVRVEDASQRDGGGGIVGMHGPGIDLGFRAILPSLKWSMLAEKTEGSGTLPSETSPSAPHLDKHRQIKVLPSLKWSMLAEKDPTGSSSHAGAAFE